MEWFQAILLGVLQGLTEFLPISSSAHLRVVPEFLGWGDPGAAFTAVVQIGTEVAVLLFFWRDIWRIGWTWLRSLRDPGLHSDPDARMGWFIIVGSLPIVVLGVLLKDTIETSARNLWLVGTMLIVFGIILGVADRVGSHRFPITHLGWRDAVLYGGAQALALVPGVSRSGITLVAAMAIGLRRDAAARFSFLLGVPAIAAAGIFELKPLLKGRDVSGGVLAVGLLAAAAAGYASIAWLLRFLRARSTRPFVVYRIVLGALLLALLFTHRLAP